MDRKPSYQAVISIEPFCIKEYKNFDSAFQVNPLVVIKKMYIKTVNHSIDSYEIFNYGLFSNKFKSQFESSFILDNWSIEEIYEGYFHGYQKDGKTGSIRFSAWNEFIFADPSGEIRRIHFASPDEGLKQLLVLSEYNSWAGFFADNKRIDYHKELKA
jgi:hypothetical protein